jgi:hypothetical protein
MTYRLFVSNRSALVANGARATDVRNAIEGAIIADAALGRASTFVELDDTQQMATHQGLAIQRPQDAPGAKAAIDAAFRSVCPAYLVIVGSARTSTTASRESTPNNIGSLLAYNTDVRRYAPLLASEVLRARGPSLSASSPRAASS